MEGVELLEEEDVDSAPAPSLLEAPALADRAELPPAALLLLLGPPPEEPDASPGAGTLIARAEAECALLAAGYGEFGPSGVEKQQPC